MISNKYIRSHSKSKSRESPGLKKRKQRIINNAIVNVDNVFIERGAGNMNWLNIAKHKLAEREVALLYKRQQALDQVIISTINSLNSSIMTIYYENQRNQFMSPSSPIMRNSVQFLADILHKWKGCKSSKEIESFRKYFQRCRGWFDTKKISPMALGFWIPIIHLLQEFSQRAAVQFVGFQNHDKLRKYGNYLNISILKSIFEATIKPSNTRKMWLVPAMIYPILLRKCSDDLGIKPVIHSHKSKEIRHQYLQYINDHHSRLKQAYYDAMYHPQTMNTTIAPNINQNANVFYNTFVPDSVLSFAPMNNHNRNRNQNSLQNPFIYDDRLSTNSVNFFLIQLE